MCLAVPGQVVAIDRSSDPVMGIVDFAGTRREVCLQWLPEVKERDYVLVHVGFALSIVDEVEAQQTLALFRELDHPADDPPR